MRYRSRNEDGQIFPLVLFAAVGILGLGFALFQVGRGTDLKARAQTGADSAALAGADALKVELLGVLTATYPPAPAPTPTPSPTGTPVSLPLPPVVVPPPVLDLTQIEASVINAAAGDYASRNDAELTDLHFDLATLTVTADVRTKGALTGMAGGAHGTAEASARLQLGGFCLPVVPGLTLPIPTCTAGELPVLTGVVSHVKLVS